MTVSRVEYLRGACEVEAGDEEEACEAALSGIGASDFDCVNAEEEVSEVERLTE